MWRYVDAARGRHGKHGSGYGNGGFCTKWEGLIKQKKRKLIGLTSRVSTFAGVCGDLAATAGLLIKASYSCKPNQRVVPHS